MAGLSDNHQELKAANQRLNDTKVFKGPGALELPSYDELLATAAPGEVRYVWQMRREPLVDGQGGVEDQDSWVNLPFCIGKCLDREYAKWVCCKSKVLKKISCFVIHVHFGTEMKFSWMLENTVGDEAASGESCVAPKSVFGFVRPREAIFIYVRVYTFVDVYLYTVYIYILIFVYNIKHTHTHCWD